MRCNPLDAERQRQAAIAGRLSGDLPPVRAVPLPGVAEGLGATAPAVQDDSLTPVAIMLPAA